MQVQAIWKQWIENLAAVLAGLHEAWRTRRTLFIACDGGNLVVRRQPAGTAEGATEPGEPLTAAHRGLGRGHFVTLELPAEQTVLRRISVPAQAHEFLAGIVRNQIDRLSPWPIDQAVYGIDAVPSATDPAQLDARVLLAARHDLDSLRERLAAFGLAADRIVARDRTASVPTPIVLWSRFDAGADGELERSGRRIGAAVLAMVAVTVALSAWALVTAGWIRDETDDVAARAALLQRRLQPAEAAKASRDPAERAWALKETSPSGVMILETLSRVLPDDAYVTELSLQKATMRITGLASDVPALVSPLEQSGLLTQVHFFAPTTRGPDGARYWFHIEARVEPDRATKESRP
jgi:general secretion pathway protein L